MDFSELIKTKPYDFLRTEPDLRNLMILTLGGSHSYGTNNEDSDVDIRGVAYNTKEKLLGLNKFEQFVNTKTDTTIYNLAKIVPLMINCNPNVLEIFGCKDKHYIVCSAEGKLLKDNIGLFLSHTVGQSFMGYAISQLRRLENAIARDVLSEQKKEEHIRNTLTHSLIHYKNAYTDFEYGSIRFKTGVSEITDILDTDYELKIDLNIKDYPLRDFIGMMNEMGSVVRDYDKIRHRNNKKLPSSLNKHAAHLVRLLLMGEEILSGKGVHTYRGNDLPLLMSIRNGKYMLEDGTYHSSFFEMIDELEKKFNYAKEHTVLPEKVDIKKIEELVININEASLK